jgi:hypothetical protein
MHATVLIKEKRWLTIVVPFSIETILRDENSAQQNELASIRRIV